MARYGIPSMILASALLAVPALAATGPTSDAPASTAPAATAPASPASPASPAGGEHTAAAPATSHATMAANQPETPKFVTSDDQLRAGKLVGATVYNDQKQSVGTINDILLSQGQDKAQTAIISVGGFLGIGSKLVSVPFDKLKVGKDRVVMPGATQQALKQMPAYKFNNNA